MIIAHVGLPGAGKSLDAVGRHILENVKKQRLVVTNIKIDARELRRQAGEANADKFLIVLDESDIGHIPFSEVDDFTKYENWRQQGDVGTGPIFVVDECAAPFADCVGLTANKHPIVAWFATHRHRGCDVVLITQGVNDIPAPIRRRIEEYHKYVRKGFIGRDQSFKRIIFDNGLNRVADADGNYNPDWFRLYRSTSVGVVEQRFKQRNVLLGWRTWFVLGLVGASVVALAYLATARLPGTKSSAPSKPAPASAPATPGVQPLASGGDHPTLAHSQAEVARLDAAIAIKQRQRQLQLLEAGCDPAVSADGFAGKLASVSLPTRCDEEGQGYRHRFDQVWVRITGHMKLGAQPVYWLELSRGGLTWPAKADDLVPFGFTVNAVSPCLFYLGGEHGVYRVTCDGPNVIEVAPEDPARAPSVVQAQGSLNPRGDGAKPVAASERRLAPLPAAEAGALSDRLRALE